LTGKLAAEGSALRWGKLKSKVHPGYLNMPIATLVIRWF
jgi:hypothetical protein